MLMHDRGLPLQAKFPRLSSMTGMGSNFLSRNVLRIANKVVVWRQE